MWVIFIIILIIAIFLLNHKSLQTLLLSKITPLTSTSKNQTLKTLLRQSSRWSLAAQQDKNPLIAVLHANYGAAYLWALKDIATSQEIESATGIDTMKFEQKIKHIQDEKTKNMVKLCPEFSGKTDEYLAAIAGEG